MGFVILSHRDPGQVLRLVNTLNRLYATPPIVCHHDFHQCALDRTSFPANVRFVEPPIRTGWAKWSIVAAFLAALALLYADEEPEWFTLLSGADYPVMSGERVIETLRRGHWDAYLDAWQIGNAARDVLGGKVRNPQLSHFDSEENRYLKWSHYLGAELWLPWIRSKPRWRLGRYTIHLPFAMRHPFRRDFCCYYGDQWFTASRRCADILLRPTTRHLALQRHLRMRTVPDECYYQTVLLNDPSLSISIDNRRFAEWNGGGAHPTDLTPAQISEVLSSGAFFARKFARDSPALDLVDAALFPESARSA